MSKMSNKEKEKLPESAFAFPKERKEPLVDARHVQEAIARFDQVQGVTNIALYQKIERHGDCKERHYHMRREGRLCMVVAITPYSSCQRR